MGISLKLIDHPFVVGGAVLVAELAIFVGLIFPLSSISAPEKKPKIESYDIESPTGAIHVTDMRSGTEFNRILQLPNGRTVVEGGYINSWGEQRIRLIGERTDP